MSFDPDLLSMMHSTFTHKSETRDGWGAAVLIKATANIPCHVTFATKIVRGDSEENITSTAQVECPPGGWIVGNVTVPTVAIDDHMTLADGLERRVLSVTRYTDDTGDYHQSVDLT